jgi:flagellar M-ring protein FliF
MADFLAFIAVAILFVLMVVAPLIMRACEVMLGLPVAHAGGPAPAAVPAARLLAPPRRAVAPEPSPPAPAGADAEPAIDLARVEGRVRASAVRQVEEMVGAHPEEAVAVLRAWLGPDPA